MLQCRELISLIVLISFQDIDLFFSIFLWEFKEMIQRAKGLSCYKDFKVKLTKPQEENWTIITRQLKQYTEILHYTNSFRR